MANPSVKWTSGRRAALTSNVRPKVNCSSLDLNSVHPNVIIARRRLRAILSFVAFCMASKLATAVPFGGEPPALGPNSTVVLQRYEPTRMELPIGGFFAPGSSIVAYREGDQDSAIFFGALFGAIGAYGATVGAASPSAERILEDTERVQVDLFAILEDKFKVLSIQSALNNIEDSKGARMQLRVTPRGFMRLKLDGTTSIEIQVLAELFDAENQEKWKSRYHYNPPLDRKLAGPQGWLDRENEQLRKVAFEGIEVGLRALTMDLNRTRYVKDAPIGQCPIGKGRLPWIGTIGDKAVVNEYVNRPTGTFVHFFDVSTCKATN